MAQAGAVWPPPSTAQSPTFTYRFKNGITRSRYCSVWFYQPNIWSGSLEITEHGIGIHSNLYKKRLAWPDIKSVTLAAKRCQVCIQYQYRMLGLFWSVSDIVPVNHEDYVSLTAALRRFAKCRVREDTKIYWSYRKTILAWSIFSLCDLFFLSTRHSHYVWYWSHALKLLNHIVSIHLL